MLGNPDLTVYAIFGGVIGGIAALMGLGFYLTRRRDRRIRAWFAATGGAVTQIELDRDDRRSLLVRYVAAAGEMRQAVIRMRPTIHATEDRPYHHVLREQGNGAGTFEDIVRMVEYSKLPGNRAMNLLILQLCEDSPRQFVELREREANNPEGVRFAAIVQAFEATNTSDELAGRMELMVHGQAFDADWWVEGEEPDRVLCVARVPTSTPGHVE